MRELNLPMPDKPVEPAVASIRDPFGIVGTTQADTFQVEKVVAHGGFGVVYKATHVLFRAPVALKCLKIPSNLSTEERTKFFERFRAEGEVMFRLTAKIPEVVRPLHVDALKLPDGRFVPFIALEWLDGDTLKDVIVRRINDKLPPMTLSEAHEMLTPVARALSKAHRFPGEDGVLAILHCDLKPDNIFVSRGDGGETIKIFDFGIAKVRVAATRQAGGATRAGETANMFTPAYAAPEQWAPDKFGQTGPWTDVFALALTLAELCTQRPAIDGPPAAMLAQCLDPGRRPTPRRLGLDIPDEVEQIFARALAVDPKIRTQSIEAFWSELASALGLASGDPRRSQPGSTDDPRRSQPLLSSQSTPSGPSGSAPVIVGRVDAPKPNAGSSQDFLGDLDLAPPPAAPAPAAPPAPQTGGAIGLEPIGLGGGGLELGAPVAAAAAPPSQQAVPTHVPEGLDAMESGDPFDLAAQPERPAPQAASAGSFLDALPPEAPPATPSNSGLLSPERKEQLKAAAQAAAQKAGAAASVAAAHAAGAARGVASRAIAVDKQPIRLDDPSTWIRPMRGPLIAFGLAVVITVVAVVGNSATGSNFPVRYVSLPLLLAAVGFIVYRWIKLQKE